MEKIRGDLVKFIQEGNGVREEAILLLGRLQSFHIQILKNIKKQIVQLDEFENIFSDLYKKFLDYDKRSGLFSETLAMAIAMDENDKSIRLPTLDEYNLLFLYASHLSAHRETLRNLLRDCENRLNNHRNSYSNQVTIFIACLSLLIAVAGILITTIQCIK